MNIRLPRIAVAIFATAVLSSCATGPFPARPRSDVALITAGYFRGGTSFGREISVIDVDGKPTDKPHGPIALAPGTHTVTMKCGDTINTQTVTVAAGEVYQFSIVTTPGVRGCSALLTRVRSTNKLG